MSRCTLKLFYGKKLPVTSPLAVLALPRMAMTSTATGGRIMKSKGTLTLDDGFLPHSSFYFAKHLLQLTYVVGFLLVLEKYCDKGSPLEKFSLVTKNHSQPDSF